MAEIIDLVLIGLFDFLGWYASEALDLSNIVQFLGRQFFYYIILQVILYLFPFLRKILNLICLPFRYIHVYLHINAAKEIIQEIEKKKEYSEEYDEVLDNGNLRVSLISGVDAYDENPSLLMSFSRPEYARRIAFAPNRLATLMTLGYFIVTPLASSELISTHIGALIHLYLFLGIFGVLMPSMNDFYFYYHSLLMNMNIRPIFFYNSVLVYILFTFDHFWRTNDFFEAILIGTFYFILYIIGLFLMGYFIQGRKIKDSRIYWVPFKNTKNLLKCDSDPEYLSLEDLDI